VREFECPLIAEGSSQKPHRRAKHTKGNMEMAITQNTKAWRQEQWLTGGSPCGLSRFTVAKSSRVTILIMVILASPFHGFGQEKRSGPLPSFEVASLKLSPPDATAKTYISPYGTGRFSASNVTLELLVTLAFDVTNERIAKAPGWFTEDRYDVSAKAEDGIELTYEQLKPRMQQLLKERFNLSVHHESKMVKGYALTIAKRGPRLKEAKGGGTSINILPRGLRMPNTSIDLLAAVLAKPLGRPVVNRTGLKGNDDIVLDYEQPGTTNTALPSLFTALQETLGLKAITYKVPIEVLVIDHVERRALTN
jgi:uncharacterized protein (TIGR03435 family)